MVRFLSTVAFVFCALACSRSHLDLHLIRSADAPIKSEESVEATPCHECVPLSWIRYDGTTIHLQIERDPFLSLTADQLSKAEIIHNKWLYRPYCDSFTLSLRVGIPFARLAQLSAESRGFPKVALLGGKPLDLGYDILDGETLKVTFG